MTDFSPNLQLPYLLASQTQKHVTLNESLIKLDNLVMLSIKSRAISSPPTSPVDGDRYIIPNNATGVWAGKTNQITCFNNLGWEYLTPRDGFLGYLIDEKQFLSFIDNAWSYLPLHNSILQNLPFLGIGTIADSTNPLSAKINNILFSAKYAAETGDGNLRIKLNKETIAKTASFLFQDNWSGRAEIGLCGNDNFSFKISNDGNIWQSAITIDKSSARTTLIGLDLPQVTVGNNEILRVGNSRLLHLKKANGTDGNNLFIGESAGNLNLNGLNMWEASYNIGVGTNTLCAVTNGFSNSAVGCFALYSNSSGFYNCGFGAYSLFSNQSGANNVGIGNNALFYNTTGSYNVAIGANSLVNNQSGNNNCAMGFEALKFKTDGTDNISFSNCSGIGNNSRVSGSNQVQLGGAGTTTYAYGAVQDRSDARDKADVRDTILGLNFINALRPVDFKWDMRDDYFEIIDTQSQDGTKLSTIKPLPKDGSKKRSRFHHGLIAQEVEEVLLNLEVDFGGYQDHLKKGGCDVKSIGYVELIAPLIKAVQELSAKVAILEGPIIGNS